MNFLLKYSSLVLFFLFTACSGHHVLLNFPDYTDELPQIATGYYSVHPIINSIPSEKMGNEFLGELVYLYKDDYFDNGKYFSGIKGSFLPDDYIRTKLVNGKNIYYWHNAEDKNKNGEITFKSISKTKLVAEIMTESQDKIDVELRFYGDQISDDSLKVIPIAHRGLCYQPPTNYDGIFPANTFPGFEAALVSGYKGFELDVRVTKDKRFMISHDEDLSASTTLRGFVRDKNLSDFENALVIKSAAIPENQATAEEAFIAAPMKSLYEVFYHFIDDPRLTKMVIDVKPDTDENLLAAAKHDFEGLSIERQKKVMFLTRTESMAKIFRDICPYSDIALEGSIGTEPVDELDRFFPEAVGLPRGAHNTISFGANWILVFKSIETSQEQISSVLNNAKKYDYKMLMWTFAKDWRLEFLGENELLPDYILCDIPYYQYALHQMKYAKQKEIKLEDKKERIAKYENPIYKRVYKQYVADFWFQSRTLFDFTYGVGSPNESKFTNSFAATGNWELKFGRSELDKFSKTNALINEWYLFVAYSSSSTSLTQSTSDQVNTEF